MRLTKEQLDYRSYPEKEIPLKGTDIAKFYKKIQELKKPMIEAAEKGSKVEEKIIKLKEKLEAYHKEADKYHRQIQFIEEKLGPLVTEQIEGQIDKTWDVLTGIDKNKSGGLVAKVTYYPAILFKNREDQMKAMLEKAEATKTQKKVK